MTRPDEAFDVYEMAHVLFLDIVRYSLQPIDRQTALLRDLQGIVRRSPEFQKAQGKGALISLPTGDGMALVFLNDPLSPVRCAVEMAEGIRQNGELDVRMGIHTGPVQRHADIREAVNVTGGGINMAQRVMDCGDAGHILISRNVAETLMQLSQWRDVLQDLGEVEVKHGVKVHLYNLWKEPAGNPKLPSKLAEKAPPERGTEGIQKIPLLRYESADLKLARRRLLAFVFALAGVAVVSLLTGIWWTRPRTSVATPIHSSQLTILLDRLTDGDADAMPLVSPDGSWLVYAGDNTAGVPMLWVRALNSPEEIPLAGTEGARAPFWSPDGRWIGFSADGRIRKIAPTGGAAQTIVRLNDSFSGAFNSGAWGKGEIVFKPLNRSPLFRIRESGGAAEQITHLDVQRTENSHRGVQFLPDGRRFVFVARCSDRSMNALYLGSLDTGKTKRLMPIDSLATLLAGPTAASGVLTYYRDGALIGRTLNFKDERVEGEPWVILNHVEYQTASIWPFFASAANGSVAIFKSSGAGSALVWHERNGLHSGSFHERNDYFQPRLSPDGKRVLFTGVDPQSGNRDVFVMELDRGVVARLTSHVANDWYGQWSPDGRSVLFASDRGGKPEMTTFLKPADAGGGPDSPFVDADTPTDWSRDGAFIAGTGLSGVIWAAEARRGSKPVTILPRGTGIYPRFSPDAKWIAYSSKETGIWEVFVRRFAGTADPGDAPIQISKSGGDFPVWNPLGGELFYMSRDASIWSVSTRDLAQRSVPAPVKLFRACEDTAVFGQPVRGQSYFMPYDTRDGKRFLLTCQATPPGKFTVLLNWPFDQRAQPR